MSAVLALAAAALLSSDPPDCFFHHAICVNDRAQPGVLAQTIIDGSARTISVTCGSRIVNMRTLYCLVREDKNCGSLDPPAKPAEIVNSVFGPCEEPTS